MAALVPKGNRQIGGANQRRGPHFCATTPTSCFSTRHARSDVRSRFPQPTGAGSISLRSHSALPKLAQNTARSLPAIFAIDPALKGDDHTNTGAEGFKPFAIGDVQPDGGFIHVFNEPAARTSCARTRHRHRLHPLSDAARTHHPLGASRAGRRANMICSPTTCSPAGRTKSMTLGVPAAANGRKARSSTFRPALTRRWQRSPATRRERRPTKSHTSGTGFSAYFGLILRGEAKARRREALAVFIVTSAWRSGWKRTADQKVGFMFPHPRASRRSCREADELFSAFLTRMLFIRAVKYF